MLSCLTRRQPHTSPPVISRLTILLLVLIACHRSFGQGELPEGPDADTLQFKISPPSHKVANSLYNRLHVTDLRIDTATLGVMTTRISGDRIIVARNLSKQIQNLLLSLVDSSAKAGDLELQLKQWTFSDLQVSGHHTGYCFLRAFLFAQDPGGYRKLDVLDTLMETRYGTVFKGNIQKQLLSSCNEMLTAFISKNLVVAPGSQSLLAWTDVMNIDSIEKSRLKLYTADTLVNGVYKTYASFKNQKPDYTFFLALYDEDQVWNVQVRSGVNAAVNFRPGDIYAVVDKGKPYVSTTGGYYPLVKKGNDYFYTGKFRTPPSRGVQGAAMAGDLLLGPGGGLLTSLTMSALRKKKFELKIDYLNGHLIFLSAL